MADLVIYKAINKINGKIYIGQTSKAVSRRIAEHIWNHSLFGKAIEKYGVQSFDISIIDIAENENILNEKEQYWIKFYNCMLPYGYNMTSGGNGSRGIVVTDETRRKISKANKGKKRSEETKRRLSNSLKKYKKTPEHCKNISLGRKGKATRKGAILSKETKIKISNSRKGQLLSEEIKRKISNTQKTIFRIRDLNGKYCRREAA